MRCRFSLRAFCRRFGFHPFGRSAAAAIAGGLFAATAGSALAQSAAAAVPLFPEATAALARPPAATAATGNIAPVAPLPGAVPGSVFIYDLNGTSTAEQSGKTLALSRSAALTAAEPLQFTVGKDSSIALAFSNGVALWAKGPASFTVSRFEQIPFAHSNRTTTYEPTRSTLEIDLARGTFSLAERDLSPMSVLRLYFGENNMLDANEATAVALMVGTEASDTADRVTVASGRALLHYAGGASSLLIGSNQFLEVPRYTAAGSVLPLPKPLTTDRLHSDAVIALQAQRVNNRVWFSNPNGKAMQARVMLPETFWFTKPFEATRID